MVSLKRKIANGFLLDREVFLVEVASSKVNKSFELHRSALGQTKFRATGILHDKVRAATATYCRAFNIKFAIPQLPSYHNENIP